MSMKTYDPAQTTRRNFLKTSTVVTGGALAFPAFLRHEASAAEAGSPLRLGLIGCGGRGAGAADQALRADPKVELVAVGDVFERQVQSSLKNLQAAHPEKIKVTKETSFVGLDAYQKVIDSGVDVVILATPPGFRPLHFKAAVAAGKHAFCEKPVAVDAPGVRSFLESAAEAKKKNLSVVAGFCWRYELGRRALYKRIHEGAIGEIRALHGTFITNPVKPMPPASTRPAGMGDVEWQLQNWYNFVWLSGDGLVEQAVHAVDKMAWAMNGVLPLSAVANGGRQVPNNEGNIYDHIDVYYDFPGGVRGFLSQRQISNCHGEVSDVIYGANGIGSTHGTPSIRGKDKWRYNGPNNNMYQQEHDELFASIRKGEPINDGVWMAHSTLMAIMGRMAAYTGQEISWEQALNSQEKLMPDNLEWNMKLPIAPMAVAGQTKFI